MNFGINDIKEMTTAMAGYPHMDYSGYGFSFLKRRLAFIYSRHNIRRINQFIAALKSEVFRDTIMSLMCVEATEMFRDPAFWRLLRDKILPLIPEDSNNVWLPYETSGEEAFSLAIILHESNRAETFRIICHNPSTVRCDNISNGFINPRHHDINQTNYKRLEDKDHFLEYFMNKNGQLAINDNFRKNIECHKGCFLTEQVAPESVGLVVFRNVAIFYSHKMSEQAFRIILDALMPGGFLVIGVKENLPRSIENELILIDAAEKVYQKPKQSNKPVNNYV